MEPSKNTPLGIWIQIANLFFLLSGVYSDLLLIRAFLVVAYGLLLLNGFLGSPLWPDFVFRDHIQLDTILWSLIGLHVHATSLIRLILDERPVLDLTDDEEALWRMFYRCGGLSKKIFHDKILPNVQVVDVKAGSIIPTNKYFYILYKGSIRVTVTSGTPGCPCTVREYIDTSGQVFDLKDMDLLHDRTPFEGDKIEVMSLTDIKVFQFTKDNIRTIVHTHKSIWQTILIENLIRFVAKEKECHQGLGKTIMDSNYCHPQFLPLEDWEQPNQYEAGSGMVLINFDTFIRHIGRTMYQSLSVPWPIRCSQAIGIRQTQLPVPKQSNTALKSLYTSLYDAVQQKQQQQQQQPLANSTTTLSKSMPMTFYYGSTLPPLCFEIDQEV